MLKIKNCLLSIVVLTSVCSCFNQADLIVGNFTCTSGKEGVKEFSFHTDDVLSITWGDTDDPYVTLEKDGELINLHQSEGWVCLRPDGSRAPLIEVNKKG